MNKKKSPESKRVESKEGVHTYLDRIGYALKSGKAEIQLQHSRLTDKGKSKEYTNRHTLLTLFPDEDHVEALKRELSTLSIDNYIETVKDDQYPDRSDLWVFGKFYNRKCVYIKIRVELLSSSTYVADNTIVVLSYHFAEWRFTNKDFPYKC